MPAQRPLEEHFWSKVDKRGPDECWLWTGPLTYKGYGRFARTVDGKARLLVASRTAWSLHHGKSWPAGLYALHTCDNPPCVNPTHIWPGTLKENSDDACAKGRRPAMCPHPKDGPHIVPRMRGSRKGWYCRICQRERNRAAYLSPERLFNHLMGLSPDRRQVALTEIIETVLRVQDLPSADKIAA